ncbi:MAG: MFS transporter [Prevotella sp.]|nr:MFS transporter [Prevotella sp.]
MKEEKKQQVGSPLRHSSPLGRSGGASPWSWIPTLYFAEALPYVAVMTIAVIMYKRLGISNTDIALYTGWLYLPWVIKPFWSPFVDLFKTKRWWTLAMQWLIAIAFAALAFAIPTPFFFQLTLAAFWIVGFTSATHDIAADGFYMHALDDHQQSFYVGIRSTFYRIATVAGQGLLVILAGVIEMNSGLEPAQLQVTASPQRITIADISEAQGVDHFEFAAVEADSTVALLDYVKQQNEANGFVEAEIEEQTTAAATAEEGAFTKWIRETFGEEPRKAVALQSRQQLVGIRLTQPRANDEPIILNVSFKNGDQSIKLEQAKLSTRFEFNKDNWNKQALMLLTVDPKLKEETTATFEGLSGNIPLAWLVVFVVLSAVFLLAALYHQYMLPRPASDHATTDVSAKTIVREFLHTFKTFFTKPQALVAILFMLLYRLPEAQLVKIINPFMLDPIDKGGLGLTTGQVGVVYGTVGIIGLTIGGILGGLAAARGGLKRWLWPMVAAITLPDLVYVYLSYAQPESLGIINGCIFIEQFGYGFGFTAYMLYLIYFSEGEHKTAHYAICTGFMALGMMLPGMMAGWLQEAIGYRHFFIWTIICCVATFLVCAFIKIDPNFGKKK